jgi:hypothetical protein
LEDQHQDPEHGAEAEQVHEDLLHRQDDRSGEHEQDGQRHRDDDREHHRDTICEAVLDVDETRGDAGRERIALQPSQVADQVLAGLAQRRVGRDDLDRVVAPASSIGGLTSATPGSREASRATFSAFSRPPLAASWIGVSLSVDRGETDAEERTPKRD